MAGYSETPLIKKLGFLPGEHIYTLAAPQWYLKLLSSSDLTNSSKWPATQAHVFFTWRSDAIKFLKENDLSAIEKALWVSWPKKSAQKIDKLQSDLTEQDFRDLILPRGWVDTKVAAIDETWSGLKFLRRR